MSKIMAGTIHIISLGCAKNLVDSEGIADLLSNNNIVSIDNPDNAEYILVNTCGFIHEAREESLEVLNYWTEHKKSGQKVIASGCMSQRYQSQLVEQVSGIDGLMGTRNINDIVQLVKKLSQKKGKTPTLVFPGYPKICNDPAIPGIAIQGKSAYLKIADGCRRACAFCAIPGVKGPLVSRPIQDILRDAKLLSDYGIQEVNLIAQDVTDYGQDLGKKDGLAQLLEQLIPMLEGVPWIRLLYTFPGSITERLIDLMAESEQLLPYLDIPLQHADEIVLRTMNRPSDLEWVRNTIATMRARIPGLAIRTTFIVGYPTETSVAFERLKAFVSEIKFDHVGVFTYSPEEGTRAFDLGDPISEETKHARLDELMSLQAAISYENNQKFVGQTLNTLIEGIDERNKISVGRTYRDAPEIDGLVIVNGRAKVGSIVPVMISSAMEHDLVGILKK